MKDLTDKKTLDLLPPDNKRPAGRPAVYTSHAARQQAYRERCKAAGKRVVSKLVLDVRSADMPLVSNIIDLSAVKRW